MHLQLNGSTESRLVVNCAVKDDIKPSCKAFIVLHLCYMHFTAWIVQYKCALFFPVHFADNRVHCASSTRSDARSGSKIAAMHLRLIFMKGFSANLTFESAPKNIGTMTQKNKIFSFSFIYICGPVPPTARMRPDNESKPSSTYYG